MANDQSGASRLEPTPPTSQGSEPTSEPRLETTREARYVEPASREDNPSGQRLGHLDAVDDADQHTRVPERQQVDQASIVDAQKMRYGGIKVGSAFFGWLTATGMALVLTALAAAAGAAVGVATNTDVGTATSQATNNAGTVGVVGAIVLLLIVLAAYYCGGYVAGRMARFDGAKQGLAVWLWALLIAGVLALIGVVAGSKYNVLGQLNAFPASRSTKAPSAPPASSPWSRSPSQHWPAPSSAASPVCATTGGSTRPGWRFPTGPPAADSSPQTGTRRPRHRRPAGITTPTRQHEMAPPGRHLRSARNGHECPCPTPWMPYPVRSLTPWTG